MVSGFCGSSASKGTSHCLGWYTHKLYLLSLLDCWRLAERVKQEKVAEKVEEKPLY